MIPIVILVSLGIGRWWSVPVLAAAWGTLVYADGVASGPWAVIGALWVAGANAAAGVGVRQLLARRDVELRDAMPLVREPQNTHVLSFLRIDPSA